LTYPQIVNVLPATRTTKLKLALQEVEITSVTPLVTEKGSISHGALANSRAEVEGA
jgi:hypothetical protein